MTEAVRSEKTAVPTGRSKRRTTIIAIQVLIGLILLVAVTRGLWESTLNPGQSEPGVPPEIGGLKLESVMTGPEALTDINRLHGKDIKLTGGWMGHYGEQAIVWVGDTANEGQAYQLVDAMTKRIQAGNPMFKNLQTQQVGATTVFSVVGQGQRHYYYQVHNKVIWLAAPVGNETRFLNAALNAIH